MFLELALLFVLILANGALVASELAMVSARRSRLERLQEAGDVRASAAIELAEHPERSLAVVQVGITLITTLSAAYAEARFEVRLTGFFDTYPILQPYAHVLSLSLVVLAITYFSLTLAELTPKRLALRNAEQLALVSAKPLAIMGKIFQPVVSLLTFSTNIVLRLLGSHEPEGADLTREDIEATIAEGAEQGVVVAEASDWAMGALRLRERSATELMTPRTEMTTVDVNDSLDQIFEQVMTSGYTRYPVRDGEPDNIIGILHVKELMPKLRYDTEGNIRDVLRPVTFITETASAPDVLSQLRREQQHMAMVVDEFGGIAGLITLEDLIEEIVGDIEDDDIGSGPGIVVREDGTLLVDGLLPMRDLREHLNWGLLPGEAEGIYETVAGFALNCLGHIPTIGERFESLNTYFEVIDMDGLRIDKIMVDPPTKPAQQSVDTAE